MGKKKKGLVITVSNYHRASTDTYVARQQMPDVIGEVRMGVSENTPKVAVPEPWCSGGGLKHIVFKALI